MKTIQTIREVATLIRIANLIFLCLALLLIRYTILIPVLSGEGISPELTDIKFTLLTLAIVLTAAGGYIINDLYDVEIDAVNKPEKSYSLSIKNIRLLYALLTLSGIVCSFISGGSTLTSKSFIITFISSGLLYFYSSDYKKMTLVGNVVVALLVAAAIFLPVMADPIAFQNETCRIIILSYAIFSFLLTMIREIIKDCEDIEGDSRTGARTLPIIVGTSLTGKIAGVLSLAVALILAWIQIQQEQWRDFPSFIYILILVQIPLLLLAIMLFRKNDKNSFHRLSLISKGIMLTGLMSMAIFYLSFKGFFN